MDCDQEDALEELSELLVFERDERKDIYCEPQHIVGLLEHYAKEGNVRMSLWLMSQSRSLDLPTYNAVLRAIISGWGAHVSCAPKRVISGYCRSGGYSVEGTLQ